jgi:hypothetical protein
LFEQLAAEDGGVSNTALNTPPPPSAPPDKPNAASVIKSLCTELLRLRAVLSGTERATETELAGLLTAHDYLFAHFPDYAASSKRPDTGNRSFLKRVRVEIDPFLRALTH